MKKVVLVLGLVGALTACGESLPDPKVSLREANCKLTVVLAHVGEKEALAERVINGDITLKEAVRLVGGLDEDAAIAQEQWNACEPLSAPPPDAGNKVM